MVQTQFWNKERELMSRDEIEKIQLKELKALVEYCYKNQKLYHDRFKERGLSPHDINSLKDIQKIPPTLKTDLRDNYPFGLVCVPMSEIVRVHASSGTTGKPTVVSYTQHDIDVWTEVMARTAACPGMTKEDIVQNAYGYGLFTGGLGFHYGAEKIGATVIPVSGGNTERQIMLMQDFGSTFLTCTPSYSLYIAEYAKKMDVDISKLKLKVGIFGAEPWSDNLRKKIEDALDIDAIDIYGLSELCGPGVSVECPEKDGLHIWEDHFLVETLDPETHEVLAPGEKGVLAFTTLTKTGQPLLRYITNDIATLNFEKCNCGRHHARMSKIMGRADDMLIVKGINVFPSAIEHVLMQIPGVSGHYQIILDREIVDSLKIKVELTPETFSDKLSDIETFKTKIEENLYNVLQIHSRVELVGPGTIPRSEGKAKRVIDMRKKEAL
ncbi:MAG: phenylacetate--CoA ligase family protein [Candidatus Helarchaeales archaeon]